MVVEMSDRPKGRPMALDPTRRFRLAAVLAAFAALPLLAACNDSEEDDDGDDDDEGMRPAVVMTIAG
jgi:hypothetical protein